MSMIAGNQGHSPLYTASYKIPAGTTGVLLAVPNTQELGVGQRLLVWMAGIKVGTGADAAGTDCTIDVGFGDSATDTADTRSNDIFDGINVEAGTVDTTNMISNTALDVAGATALSGPFVWEVDDWLLVHVAQGSAVGLDAEIHLVYGYMPTVAA